MKISFCFIIIAVVATGLGALPTPALADAPATNAAPAVVKPAKPAAAPKAAAKPAAKKAEPKPEPVFNPEPGVARQANVNIRGQAKINSEIVGHLKKGESITILEEITIAKPKQDEPARWFRILLPSGTNTSVWIHSSFVDAARPR